MNEYINEADYDRLAGDAFPPFVEVALVVRTADGQQVTAARIPAASITWERVNLFERVPDPYSPRTEIAGSITQFKITTAGPVEGLRTEVLRPQQLCDAKPRATKETR